MHEDKTVTAIRRPESAAAMPAPAPGHFATGTRIRQYELMRELGRGGMGQVFLARDTRLARRVAMKFLMTASRDDTARFLVEARTTAQCTHENIVVIHEVDEHEGIPYMVLEHLEGTSLRAIATGQPMPIGSVVERVLPVVRALIRAHEFGIVHRDLKPENIFATSTGAIKVLDFGIAKLLGRPDDPLALGSGAHGVTGEGGVIGTLPYMSPEQLAGEVVDHRTDLWAVGILLHELATGRHPLAPVSVGKLLDEFAAIDRPIALADAALPDAFREIIGRCLVKRKTERIDSARALCTALEELLPGRHGRRLAEDESPYPGLVAFQEGDADRFFGREHDVARVVARLRDHALIGVVGPSGAGKSSLVRAGLVPALKLGGDAWEVHVVRPGRAPIASLARLLDGNEGDLAREPGALGAALRARASSSGARILVFVDQLEELYTHGGDEEMRRAFIACLAGIADDPGSALRVVVAMRSDFLDRAGEHPEFLDDLTRGLVFLQPLSRDGLREALTRPLEPRGYALETPQLADQIIDVLATTSGALPLLQFAAHKLWMDRDRERKLLTTASHAAMGGLAGALATHADDVIATLAPAQHRLARTVLQRLVTPERTRAIVPLEELRGLAGEPARVDALVDHLVAARLLVVQRQGEADSNTAELVHESLIAGWPTLRRWLDEDQEDAAYITQLRAAATQWEQKGRTAGLLWRGEAEREARQFRARFKGELAVRERDFLDAVVHLGARAARIRRGLAIGSFVVLAGIAVASAIALVRIRDAEHVAQDEATHAQTEKTHAQDEARHAQDETQRALAAETEVKRQLDALRAAQTARATAEAEATAKGTEAEMSKEQLEVALKKARLDQARAEDESRRAKEAETQAQAAAEREKRTREDAQRLYEAERQRAAEAEARSKQITTKLAK